MWTPCLRLHRPLSLFNFTHLWFHFRTLDNTGTCFHACPSLGTERVKDLGITFSNYGNSLPCRFIIHLFKSTTRLLFADNVLDDVWRSQLHISYSYDNWQRFCYRFLFPPVTSGSFKRWKYTFRTVTVVTL